MTTSLIDSLPGRVITLAHAVWTLDDLIQLIIIGAALSLAVFTARAVRLGRESMAPEQSSPGTLRFPGVMREALRLSAPYVASIATLLAGHGLLAPTNIDTSLLNLGLRLLGSLIAIRSAVFLLFLSLTPNHRLRSLEARSALLIWFFVAMYILGWLEAFIAYLDAVPILNAPRAEAPVTLWSILKSLVTVIVFVIFSAWVGRVLEQRIGGVVEEEAARRDDASHGVKPRRRDLQRLLSRVLQRRNRSRERFRSGTADGPTTKEGQELAQFAQRQRHLR